jgi:hypothetical protein
MVDILNKADGIAITTDGWLVLIDGVVTLAMGEVADDGTDEDVDRSSISEMSPSFDSKVFVLDDSLLMQEESQITEMVVTSHHSELN